MGDDCSNKPNLSDPLQVGNGTPFSVLLARAVKLKSWQMAASRSKFDSFPRFYQNTIFSNDAITVIRTKSFTEQIECARNLSKEARDAYGSMNYLQSYSKYELALSIFKYLRNTNSNWRNEGIKDIDLEDVIVESDNLEENREIRLIRLKCYTNIAVTALKLEWYNVSLDACNAALDIDDSNVKALFLRSKARFLPKFNRPKYRQLALQDLTLAARLDPTNNQIRHELIKQRSEWTKEQRVFRKMFKGIFKRETASSVRDNGRPTSSVHVSSGSGSYRLFTAVLEISGLRSRRDLKNFVCDLGMRYIGIISIANKLFLFAMRFQSVVFACLIIILGTLHLSTKA